MITIAPSILSADFAKLGEELYAIKRAGADMIHLDVMDGVFVPNMSFGFPVISSARRETDLFFDAHAMITDPRKYVDEFVRAGADRLTIHLEAQGDAAETVAAITDAGIEAGVALSPDTPAEAVFPLLENVSLVLVMTVHPGFGGQSFMPAMCDKIKRIYDRKQALGLTELSIQVDGGIIPGTAATAAAAGADCFVAGSAIFGAQDYSAAITAMRGAAADAYPKEVHNR